MSPLRGPGAQEPTRPQSYRRGPIRLPPPSGHRGDGKEAHSHLNASAWPVGGLGKGYGALKAGLRPGELESSREKAGIHLLPHSLPEDRHSPRQDKTGR